MKRFSFKHSPLKSKKGLLTLDFLFALIMIFAFTSILFGFSITFTAVEIAQYATFAASRAYFAANKTSDDQEQAGTRKFNALINARQAPLGTIFKNGWFTLSPVELKDFNSEYSTDPNVDSDTFIGARTTLTAKILQKRFPLLGSTSEDALSAKINSFLMREPTEEECVSFVQERFSRFLQLETRFTAPFVRADAYTVIMDDGC